MTARKIREHGRPGPAPTHTLGPSNTANLGRVYTGFLISYPVVGRGMVIFRDPHGHRMITTPVRRVLGGPNGQTLYVETENSVYRLTFNGAPLIPMAAPASGEAAG